LCPVWEAHCEGILEALWARRCFATNGEHIVLDVRMNGSPMGTEVTASGVVTVHCTVESPRVIQQIDLFRDGEPVAGHEPSDVQASVVLEDHPEPGEHVYYVRVRVRAMPRAPLPGQRGNLQGARGDYAWSSPIWVHAQASD
jgi:hypothetical protein